MKKVKHIQEKIEKKESYDNYLPEKVKDVEFIPRYSPYQPPAYNNTQT